MDNQINMNQFVCRKGNCGQKFDTYDARRMHEKRHDKEALKVQCRLCQLAFSRPDVLKKHIDTGKCKGQAENIGSTSVRSSSVATASAVGQEGQASQVNQAPKTLIQPSQEPPSSTAASIFTGNQNQRQNTATVESGHNDTMESHDRESRLVQPDPLGRDHVADGSKKKLKLQVNGGTKQEVSQKGKEEEKQEINFSAQEEVKHEDPDYPMKNGRSSLEEDDDLEHNWMAEQQPSFKIQQNQIFNKESENGRDDSDTVIPSWESRANTAQLPETTGRTGEPTGAGSHPQGAADAQRTEVEQISTTTSKGKVQVTFQEENSSSRKMKKNKAKEEEKKVPASSIRSQNAGQDDNDNEATDNSGSSEQWLAQVELAKILLSQNEELVLPQYLRLFRSEESLEIQTLARLLLADNKGLKGELLRPFYTLVESYIRALPADTSVSSLRKLKKIRRDKRALLRYHIKQLPRFLPSLFFLIKQTDRQYRDRSDRLDKVSGSSSPDYYDLLCKRSRTTTAAVNTPSPNQIGDNNNGEDEEEKKNESAAAANSRVQASNPREIRSTAAHLHKRRREQKATMKRQQRKVATKDGDGSSDEEVIKSGDGELHPRTLTYIGFCARSYCGQTIPVATLARRDMNQTLPGMNLLLNQIGVTYRKAQVQLEEKEKVIEHERQLTAAKTKETQLKEQAIDEQVAAMRAEIEQYKTAMEKLKVELEQKSAALAQRDEQLEKSRRELLQAASLVKAAAANAQMMAQQQQQQMVVTSSSTTTTTEREVSTVAIVTETVATNTSLIVKVAATDPILFLGTSVETNTDPAPQPPANAFLGSDTVMEGAAEELKLQSDVPDSQSSFVLEQQQDQQSMAMMAQDDKQPGAVGATNDADDPNNPDRTECYLCQYYMVPSAKHSCCAAATHQICLENELHKQSLERAKHQLEVIASMLYPDNHKKRQDCLEGALSYIGGNRLQCGSKCGKQELADMIKYTDGTIMLNNGTLVDQNFLEQRQAAAAAAQSSSQSAPPQQRSGSNLYMPARWEEERKQEREEQKQLWLSSAVVDRQQEMRAQEQQHSIQSDVLIRTCEDPQNCLFCSEPLLPPREIAVTACCNRDFHFDCFGTMEIAERVRLNNDKCPHCKTNKFDYVVLHGRQHNDTGSSIAPQRSQQQVDFSDPRRAVQQSSSSSSYSAVQQPALATAATKVRNSMMSMQLEELFDDGRSNNYDDDGTQEQIQAISGGGNGDNISCAICNARIRAHQSTLPRVGFYLTSNQQQSVVAQSTGNNVDQQALQPTADPRIMCTPCCKAKIHVNCIHTWNLQKQNVGTCNLCGNCFENKNWNFLKQAQTKKKQKEQSAASGDGSTDQRSKTDQFSSPQPRLSSSQQTAGGSTKKTAQFTQQQQQTKLNFGSKTATVHSQLSSQSSIPPSVHVTSQCTFCEKPIGASRDERRQADELNCCKLQYHKNCYILYDVAFHIRSMGACPKCKSSKAIEKKYTGTKEFQAAKKKAKQDLKEQEKANKRRDHSHDSDDEFTESDQEMKNEGETEMIKPSSSSAAQSNAATATASTPAKDKSSSSNQTALKATVGGGSNKFASSISSVNAADDNIVMIEEEEEEKKDGRVVNTVSQTTTNSARKLGLSRRGKDGKLQLKNPTAVPKYLKILDSQSAWFNDEIFSEYRHILNDYVLRLKQDEIIEKKKRDKINVHVLKYWFPYGELFRGIKDVCKGNILDDRIGFTLATGAGVTNEDKELRRKMIDKCKEFARTYDRQEHFARGKRAKDEHLRGGVDPYMVPQLQKHESSIDFSSGNLVLLLPIHVFKNHWALLVGECARNSRRVVYFDSMLPQSTLKDPKNRYKPVEQPREQFAAQLLQQVNAIGMLMGFMEANLSPVVKQGNSDIVFSTMRFEVQYPDEEWRFPYKCPQQRNTYDCGLYVCMQMRQQINTVVDTYKIDDERRLKVVFDKSQEGRQLLKEELLSGTAIEMLQGGVPKPAQGGQSNAASAATAAIVATPVSKQVQLPAAAGQNQNTVPELGDSPPTPSVNETRAANLKDPKSLFKDRGSTTATATGGKMEETKKKSYEVNITAADLKKAEVKAGSQALKDKLLGQKKKKKEQPSTQQLMDKLTKHHSQAATAAFSLDPSSKVPAQSDLALGKPLVPTKQLSLETFIFDKEEDDDDDDDKEEGGVTKRQKVSSSSYNAGQLASQVGGVSSTRITGKVDFSEIQDLAPFLCGTCQEECIPQTSTDTNCLLTDCCRQVVHRTCYEHKVQACSQHFNNALRKEVVQLKSGFPDLQKQNMKEYKQHAKLVSEACSYCRRSGDVSFKVICLSAKGAPTESTGITVEPPRSNATTAVKGEDTHCLQQKKDTVTTPATLAQKHEDNEFQQRDALDNSQNMYKVQSAPTLLVGESCIEEVDCSRSNQQQSIASHSQDSSSSHVPVEDSSEYTVEANVEQWQMIAIDYLKTYCTSLAHLHAHGNDFTRFLDYVQKISRVVVPHAKDGSSDHNGSRIFEKIRAKFTQVYTKREKALTMAAAKERLQESSKQQVVPQSGYATELQQMTEIRKRNLKRNEKISSSGSQRKGTIADNEVNSFVKEDWETAIVQYLSSFTRLKELDTEEKIGSCINQARRLYALECTDASTHAKVELIYKIQLTLRRKELVAEEEDDSATCRRKEMTADSLIHKAERQQQVTKRGSVVKSTATVAATVGKSKEFEKFITQIREAFASYTLAPAVQSADPVPPNVHPSGTLREEEEQKEQRAVRMVPFNGRQKYWRSFADQFVGQFETIEQLKAATASLDMFLADLRQAASIVPKDDPWDQAKITEQLDLAAKQHRGKLNELLKVAPNQAKFGDKVVFPQSMSQQQQPQLKQADKYLFDGDDALFDSQGSEFEEVHHHHMTTTAAVAEKKEENKDDPTQQSQQWILSQGEQEELRLGEAALKDIIATVLVKESLSKGLSSTVKAFKVKCGDCIQKCNRREKELYTEKLRDKFLCGVSYVQETTVDCGYATVVTLLRILGYSGAESIGQIYNGFIEPPLDIFDIALALYNRGYKEQISVQAMKIDLSIESWAASTTVEKAQSTSWKEYQAAKQAQITQLMQEKPVACIRQVKKVSNGEIFDFVNEYRGVAVVLADADKMITATPVQKNKYQGHFFVVYAFDQEKEIVYVLDSVQKTGRMQFPLREFELGRTAKYTDQATIFVEFSKDQCSCSSQSGARPGQSQTKPKGKQLDKNAKRSSK